MNINQDTLNLIKYFEGFSSKAYPDPGSGGEPITICYGTTVYPNGSKVKLGDIRTKEECEKYFLSDIERFSTEVAKYIKRTISDNQFGALVSFAYNVGINNFRKSTLLKKVNINPKDLSIASEFAKWKTSSGIVLSGLVKRRQAESALYFS